jgi:hypothetical protein
MIGALALCLFNHALAQAPTPPKTEYTVDSWPSDLATIPCDAFRKNSGGSWTQTGTIKVTPSLVMSGKTFNANTVEARMLSQRCGGK